MEKKTKSIVAVVVSIAVVLIAAAVIVAVFVTQTKRQPQNPNDTHVFGVKEGREKLIENGESDYAILIPSDADTFTSYAAEEMQFFIMMPR